MCYNNTCRVHVRCDLLPEVTDAEYFAVTYVGDKVVVTTDNPNYHNLYVATLSALQGILHPMFLTRVIVLDSEDGVIGDYIEWDPEKRVEREIFSQPHGELPEGYKFVEENYERFMNDVTRDVHAHHSMVVDLVRADMLVGK